MNVRILYTLHKHISLIIVFILFMLLSSLSTALSDNTGIEYQHVYIDQVNGTNTSNTTGSEADPFKSITYAVLKNRDNSTPLIFNVKAGVYDANPNKAANEREIFPIDLKNFMIIQGIDEIDKCVINGAFNSNSKAAILRGQNLSDFSIRNLTIQNMKRSETNGGACELINCSGVVEACIFKENGAKFGAALYISGNFNGSILDNTFTSNRAIIDGGAFCITGNYTGDISNNLFNNNYAEKEEGGAFHIEKSMYGNIFSNSFNNNFADNNGGGFSIWGSLTGDVKNNVFVNNKVDDIYGGAFYINSNFIGNLLDNKFSGNSAHNNGGGFAIAGYLTGNISNNTFNDNVSYYRGGGFYITNLTGNISNNIFCRNSSTEYDGGAFYIYQDMKAKVSNNSFSENFADENGGGFYVRENFIGDITGNMFSKNYVTDHASGVFYIGNNFTGDIIKNTFSGNYAKNEWSQTFRINGTLDGRIDGNLFSKKSAFYLNAGGKEPVIISNNYFVYRHIVTKQNIHVFNNTFYGSGVSIFNSASSSIIKNNIFANTYTAIWEEGELNVPIMHNNFHNLTNILHRNNQEMGGDSFFIEMLLPDTYKSNTDFATGIIGEDLDTGIWTDSPNYENENNLTVFTDNNKNWQENEWIGAMINLSNSSTTRQHYLIATNTSTQIKVLGFVVSENLGQQDHIYSIDDYRLSANSQNIDLGTTNSVVDDFEKEWRPQGGYFDIGADEYFKGEMIPGIAHIDPPATNITSESATLRTQVNPNELSSTCYFEYGTDISYGFRTSDYSGYTGSGLFLINSDITDLSPNTEYHFRLVATNSTGTAYGNNHSFITQPITASIKGKVSLAIAGHAGLVVKNADIKLEGTNYETTTNSKGEFFIGNIPASDYKIIISADNLLIMEQEVTLSEGQNIDIGVKEMYVPSTEGVEAILQSAIITERKRWDSNGDNKKGLPEAIDALKSTVNFLQ